MSDDAVDRLLDDLVAGAGLRVGDPLAEAAWQIRALATEPLPPETRERHLARIRSALAPPQRRRGLIASRLAGFRRRVAAVATAVTAVLTLSGGVTYAAAQQALPGDALYGVKRASERLALALEQDPGEDAKLRVGFAQRRLREAAAVPELSDELVAEAIAHLEYAAATPGPASSQSLEIIRQLLGGLLPAHASEQAQYALAQVCLKLAQERGEPAPSTCEAQAAGQSPPGPSQAGVPQGGPPQGGPPQGGPPQGGPPQGGPPQGGPPQGGPPQGGPPPGQQSGGQPPGGGPDGGPPAEGNGPPGNPQPPGQDPGGKPHGGGKGYAESEYPAPDHPSSQSGRDARREGPGRAGERGRAPRGPRSAAG